MFVILGVNWWLGGGICVWCIYVGSILLCVIWLDRIILIMASLCRVLRVEDCIGVIVVFNFWIKIVKNEVVVFLF